MLSAEPDDRIPWSGLAGAMDGRLVRLEPLCLEHEDELFAVAGPPEIWEWRPINPAVDRSAFHAWLADVLEADATGAEATPRLRRARHTTSRVRDGRGKPALATGPRALPAHFEGVMRDWKIVGGGRRRSSAIYSILDHEWPAVEANLAGRVQARAA